MSITFTRSNKLFKITTKSTLYAFDIVNDRLIHRYYGRKAGAKVSTFADAPGHVVSFAPYRSEDEVFFSLDTQPLEYSCFGSGDFRATSLRIRSGHGNAVTDFVYISHKIVRGRVDIPDIPCARADDKTQTLDITLRDSASECELHLYYTAFYDCDVISRYASVTNRGGGDVTIEKWMSLCLDLDGSEYDVISLGGRHAFERMVYERTPVFRGNLSLHSRRGASSHQMNPFMAVVDRKAAEDRGDVYGFNFVYSGSFLNEVEGEPMGRTRVQVGLGDENFRYRLRSGETVFAPEAVMTYSPKGIGIMSRNFHDFVNAHILPEKAKERRPVVLNSWEAFFFDIDENIMVDFAKAASDCGMDMVIMDDGWFGARVNDKAGLGDWFVNKNRFKDGLGPFVERVKRTGVKFGIWVEPEMVNPDSDLFRAHPDWCIRCPDRPMSYSRSQYVLDMANPAVVEYLKGCFAETFRDVPIDYFKWDMNRHISEPGSPYLAAEDQGSVEYRYYKGVYSLFKWFKETYPDAMIENCSGGGGRYDLAMMTCCSQIWTSDNTSAVDRIFIQYSSMLAYPASVMSCHVSNPHGDLTELDIKYKVAINGVLGYEFNVLDTPDAVKDVIRRQVADYRMFDDVITTGKYYRLSSPYESDISAYYTQLTEGGSDRILLSAVKTDGRFVKGKKKPCRSLAVKGADSSAVYRDLLGGGTVTGEQLRRGIEVGEFVTNGAGFGAKVWYWVKE